MARPRWLMRFDHESPAQRVCFGTGQAADLVKREVDLLGERVLLIASEAETAIAEPLASALPVVAVFRDVAMHVPLRAAERAREAAEHHAADVILSVGGGSTTGTAKAVALTSGAPIVCVPTTYAGSEATNVWGITDAAKKQTGTDPRVLPRSIIYDAELSRMLPIDFSVASGFNALAHCVDSIWAPRANQINRAFALEGIRALRRGLHQIKADPRSLDGREQMLLAAYLSATAFSSAGSGLHHKLCHVLGGNCDLPHAETHAVVLPYVLAFNGAAGGQAMSGLAAAFGADTADAGLRQLRADMEAPTRLADYGLRVDQVAAVAREVMAALPAGNPRPVSVCDIEAIIDAARVGADPCTAATRADLVNDPATHQATAPIIPNRQIAREEELVERVLASFSGARDPRLKHLLEASVRHLHALLREVRITEQEWSRAIDFLTAVGHASDARRQEFVLLSDVLGLSMQMISINNEAYANATEATVLGPFFLEDSPEIPLGADIAFDAVGEPCWVEGRVSDTTGKPVAGALLEVWEADEDGYYDVQYPDARMAGRGRLRAASDGAFSFWALTPTPYPIPNDGPVGRLLEASGRSPMRASHLHFRVTAPDLRTLVTHIFVAGDELLATDTVFGVKPSLIKDFARQSKGTATPDGRDLEGRSWSRVRFDIVLAPAVSAGSKWRN